MKFKRIRFFEMQYKMISMIAVTFFTLFWVISFQGADDLEEMILLTVCFFVLLLFTGVYYEWEKKMIDLHFEERKIAYYNLKKLEEFFEYNNTKNYSDKSVYFYIQSFKSFTGRTEEMCEFPYITEQGFQFDLDELKVEDDFIKARTKILLTLQNKIQNYVLENEIGMYVKNVEITDVSEFNVEGWCIENIIDDGQSVKNVERLIYDTFERLSPQMDEMEILMRQVMDYYTSYLNLTIQNLNLLEKLYGNQLTLK